MIEGNSHEKGGRYFHLRSKAEKADPVRVWDREKTLRKLGRLKFPENKGGTLTMEELPQTIDFPFLVEKINELHKITEERQREFFTIAWNKDGEVRFEETLGGRNHSEVLVKDILDPENKIFSELKGTPFMLLHGHTVNSYEGDSPDEKFRFPDIDAVPSPTDIVSTMKETFRTMKSNFVQIAVIGSSKKNFMLISTDRTPLMNYDEGEEWKEKETRKLFEADDDYDFFNLLSERDYPTKDFESRFRMVREEVKARHDRQYAFLKKACKKYNIALYEALTTAKDAKFERVDLGPEKKN